MCKCKSSGAEIRILCENKVNSMADDTRHYKTYRPLDIYQWKFSRTGKSCVHLTPIILQPSNSLNPGRHDSFFKFMIFKRITQSTSLGFRCDIALMWMPQSPIDDLVNIGLGKGLMPSDSKSLPVPKLTQIFVAIWHHQATMS